MTPASPTPAEMEFFYHGFHRVLLRYRAATILGWVVVLVGVAGVPLGWRAAGAHGLLDLALCGGAIAAGLVLVSECVSFLHAYLAVPFPRSGENAEAPSEVPAITEICSLMRDVEEAGWQEAYAAIARLRAIGASHGFPPPGGPAAQSLR